MSLTGYKRVAPDKVNIINLATGSIVISLRLAPLGNPDLHQQYVDNVVEIVERYIAYHNSPNCMVSVRNTVFSSIGTVANGNQTNIVVKATGTIIAVVIPYGGNSLFDLSLINGVAHASEVYIASIGRYQKSLATDKVMANRQQALHKIMRRN